MEHFFSYSSVLRVFVSDFGNVPVKLKRMSDSAMPISDVTTKGLDLSSSKASVYENSPVKHDLPKRQQCFSDTSLRATFMGVPVASISRSSSLWHFSTTGVTEQSNLRQYFSFFSLKQQASLLAYSERFPFFGREITSHLQVFEDQY